MGYSDSGTAIAFIVIGSLVSGMLAVLQRRRSIPCNELFSLHFYYKISGAIIGQKMKPFAATSSFQTTKTNSILELHTRNKIVIAF